MDRCAALRRACLLLAGLLLCSACATLAAIEPREFAESADQARYEALIEELRCLVCQNESLAESNADLAADLRAEVAGQILAGRSDAQIVDYLTARYGDFVLYRPPFKPVTWALWLGPLALLLMGSFVVWRTARTAGGSEALTEAEQQRLRTLLDEEDSR